MLIGREEKSMLRWIVVAAIAIGSAGCSSLAGWSTTETALLQSDTIAPDQLPPPAPVFCYRTLAKVDCHARPLADGRSRLVGAYPE